ncbi:MULTISPECIES: tetratricopeptide repeat protein [unclassified Empedobacter]|uniref:tetratricopeptide repeat protein n=1 Tax=unclassified Empedobacter TaxID=2643773 RepID=UPI002575B311|nr:MULTISPECIES: tetratricopeptide repeat protein [unclassified Empedobacter]MDM1140015.1 tetratricopeptide repeat protein [Empedobacter sp. R132-2]
MNKNTPTVRQIAWIALIPQLLFMTFLVLMFYLFNSKEPFMFGALTYLIISFSVRGILTKNQKKGMEYIKQGNYAEAINEFQRSFDFFQKNEWIDKYRYLTLLTASKSSYREMALNNIAFSYSQMGNGQKAREYYEKTLQLFPENGMATSAINILNSGKNME